MSAHETVTLHAGFDIVVGDNRIQVREVAASAGMPFRFVAERKGGGSAAQVIEQEIVLVGRKSVCPIQLNDPAVAAVHAELEHRPDGVWITDESSGAGVYVNGQRVVQQQLHSGDVVTIRPFEIAISLTDEMCVLGIQDSAPESQPAPENIPGNYREVVVPPPHVEGGQAKPSASISALPHWMRAKAPIWVPTSDILPNRFRSRMLLIGLLCVLGWAAIAFAAKWNSAYSPGPLNASHAAFGCESCHSSFARVSDTSCQACHADQKASAIHQSQMVGCAGLPFRTSRSEVRYRAQRRQRVSGRGLSCHSSHRGKESSRPASPSAARSAGSNGSLRRPLRSGRRPA